MKTPLSAVAKRAQKTKVKKASLQGTLRKMRMNLNLIWRSSRESQMQMRKVS